MKLKRELMHVAAKVKGKLTHVFDHDQLETLARQSGWLMLDSRVVDLRML